MPKRRVRGILSGVRVAVTRMPSQSAALVSALEAEGAEVVVMPLIRVVPPADPASLEGAARRVDRYDWIVFTSSNGVEYFSAALADVGVDAAGLTGLRVACIGPGTAAAAERAGWRLDLISDQAIAESLLDGLLASVVVEGNMEGVRLLLPVAAGARDVLERGLSAAGLEVERVEAYRTECDVVGAGALLDRLGARSIDLVLFASPSAVSCFAAAAGVGGAGSGWSRVLGGARVGVIGPVTGAEARRHGLEVQIEASEYTASGLAASIVEYYGSSPDRGGC